MRTAYEYNAGKRREVINRLEASTLEVLRLATEDERADRLKNAKEQLDIVESETPIDGIECKGRLKLTLEGVLRGEEGIRDEWMVKNWAKKNNFDLQQMARERRLFRKWLEMHTGTPTRNQGIWPPHFGEHAENKPQFLEACAKVRYRARFADNTGTVVYLADCELNEEPSVPERDEVVRLLGCTTDRREATAEAEQLSLDVVLNKLGSTLGKKGFVPMGVPGFIKLCKREGISLETVQKKGMKRAKLESLLKKRESQKRKRKSQLKNHTKAISKGKLTENPTRVGSKSNGDQATEAPEGSHIAVGGSLGPLEKKLREIDEGKRLD